ncbi:citrate synthase [Fusarium subglutinans]|uniref:Citrate synthase n=1 Tax=Gibberella subglutinans TaxID=42677 RepID=A0A8H5NWT1_GIBSU|nr:citrate synthase [Fusarium subglutinans]KAF5578575.1 citrate synthase [Fusarium subglutinans]
MDNSFSPVIKRCRQIIRSLVLSGAWVYQKAMGHADNSISSGILSVTDSRTGRSYNIPIRNNAVKALDFIQITTAGFGAEVADHYDNSLRVLDKGLWNTAVTETSITYIDGKAGHMQYRDKTIDELFHNNNYEEVVHLIIWGSLPTQEQKMNLRRKLASHMKPPQSVENAIKAFPPDGLTHPMLLAGIAAFAAHDKGSQAVHRSSEPAYLGNMEEVDDAIIRTLAALATTVAMVYCYRRGRPFTQANPDESYTGNILLMMGLTEEGSSSTPNRKIEHCLERLWVLNADHGMTNSTAVFLAAASTLQDPLSCTVAAVASAYGPLHGGAVEMAYKEFERVQCVENVPQLISDVKAKKYRLFGYGHRIYKVKDPRGQLVRQLIEEYKEDVYKNSFLRVAMEIDRVAEEDSYFISRNLKANADLYGCFLYTALGIETDTILSLSCLSRSPGVMAHWRESMAQSPAIWRPQHIFTGTIAADNNCKI